MMFRFTRKPSSGSHNQYLAKVTHSVQCGYMEVVQAMSVLWLHIVTCEACAVFGEVCRTAVRHTSPNRAHVHTPNVMLLHHHTNFSHS